MPLGKYSKSNGERKRYTVLYEDWLDTGELVQGSVFTVVDQTATDLLVVDSAATLPAGSGIQFYVSGGLLGSTYEVVVTMTTDQTQVKEDSIIFTIREP